MTFIQCTDLRGNLPALAVRVDGKVLMVGPRVGPGFGCLTCLEAWHALRAPFIPPLPNPPGEPERATSLARAYYERNPQVEWDTSIALFSEGSEIPQIVRVLPRSNCPDCHGQPAFGVDDKFNILANPLTGLVLGAQALPRAFGLSWAHGAGLSPLPHQPVGVSGVGATPAEARRRMVAEAIERHSICYTGVEPAMVAAESDSGGPAKEFPAKSIYLHHPDGGADSTGCAAGPTIEMARRHAWLEVLERDAFTHWWTNRGARSWLDFAPTDWLIAVAEALAKGDRKIWWLDLSRHLGVTVVAALSSTTQGEQVYLGAAADTDPARAAERATQEMLQFLIWDQITGPPPQRQRWFASHSLKKDIWLAPAKQVEAPELVPPPEGYWADLTRPWLGVPVVRVLLPGCRTLPEDVPI